MRDYIHVSDLVDAHILALGHLEGGGGNLTMNCGHGKGVSILEVVAAVERAIGGPLKVRSAPRRPGDPPVLIAAADKIKARLGWQPKYDLDAMVTSALKWERQWPPRPTACIRPCMAETAGRLPLVGIPADYRVLGGAGVHVAEENYVRAISEQVGAIPLILPVLDDGTDFRSLLGTLDGLLLTGSQSNVAPARYGVPSGDPGVMHDPARDAQNFALIHSAVVAGVPLLAICRGFQETNVAIGGSLHPKLHEQPGRIDHRAPAGQPVDVQYDMAHPVDLPAGGVLRTLLGADRVMVNSVHWQGVDRLAEGLAVEATAPDGTIEAVRVAGAAEFALAVQWHPEHRPTENPVSRAIFAAFRAAVTKRAEGRKG